MGLEIPKEDVGAITIVSGLSASSLDKLIAALESAPPLSNTKEMTALVSKQVPSTSAGQLAQIIEVLYTLYYIRELSGVEHSRFLNDLIAGIRKSSEREPTSRDLSKLRTKLERLLGIATLGKLAKAARLQRDGERLYCTAKILSDIRPVFGPDPAIRPLGAVITHTLRVGYHSGKDHREFHVTMDADDLETLSETIARAQAKENTLRELMKDSKLMNLTE